MDEKEIELRSALRDDFIGYARACLKIRTKEGEIKSLILNEAQLYIHKKLEEQKAKIGYVRAIILKGRQEGCSTYIDARHFHIVTHKRGFRAFILTHDKDATDNLFEMAQRYYSYCPEIVKPRAGTDNAKELEFIDLDSGYKIGTAGNKSVGRSHTIQVFHGSEVAFWPNATEHAKGIMQALSGSPGTESILESTANGVGNYFYQQWQLAESGKSEYIPIFIPWFWAKEYQARIDGEFHITSEEQELRDLYGLTNEQLLWRRKKIIELSVNGLDGKKAFMQEYPCCPTEAFQTTGEDNFISPQCVMKARKSDYNDRYGQKVLGVDPARFGDDRTSFIRRHGRVAYGLESYSKIDTMATVGLVSKIIKEEKIDKVLVDVGGLGAGVVDRLKELGYGSIIVAVNGGESAFESEKYRNRRAEMWAKMKEWLNESPVNIPDKDSLHADICGPKYNFDSNTRLLIEKKEDMKKRGIRSPDEGDALALTFALPLADNQIDLSALKNPLIKI